MHVFNESAFLQVNKGPFDEGWMLKVKLSNASEVDDLLDASAYEKHCEDSTH